MQGGKVDYRLMGKTGQIKVMSPELASQIAAGEVVERGASVVKELVENSLDAGATEIEVEVSLVRRHIRVRDNGEGIPPGELELAVARHGTSKVSDLKDIFEISTYGFRGEALPSIASVSKMTLVSHRRGEREGRSISVEGGEVKGTHGAPAINGTEVTVDNLFYNTPARRKFTRAATTEMGYVTSRIIQTAIATPAVRYTFIKEKKRVLELPPAEGMMERVHQIFGAEYSRNLVPIEGNDGNMRVGGLAGKPGFYRATTIDQYFFVNGRPVRDPLMRIAVSRSFDDLVPKGKKPVVFVSVQLPVNEVDVNVHPAKLEVRFADPGRVSTAITSAIRASLERHTNAGARPHMAAQPVAPGAFAAEQGAAHYPRLSPAFTPLGIEKPAGGFERSFELWSEPIRAAQPGAVPDFVGDLVPAQSHGRLSPDARVVGQIFSTFFLVEDGDSLMVMDQHTVHERILFEKFMSRFNARGVERQRLLIPETVDAGSGISPVVRAHMATFTELGWGVEEFGENSFIIREVPHILAGKDVATIFVELAETIAADRDTDYRTMLSDLVSRMACRGAVMAGDNVAKEDIAAMINELGMAKLPYTCPHGRPVAFELKKDALYRHFGRKG